VLRAFRQDVRRWVVPEQIAPAAAVTLRSTIKLLAHYKPLRAMLWYRIGSYCSRRRIRLVPTLVMWILSTWYGMELELGRDVGGGLYIPHPVGMVLYPSRLGENCSIIASVTIGMRNEHAFPDIGDNVYIGAGARVLGGIHIGDRAVIGANAVVLKDVPAGATVVGIPARVIRQEYACLAQPD
jgi:serine O-acetyltransferase